MSEICAIIVDEDCNNPLVSVGIPTYNRPDGLRRTLECITGQSYKNLEIIVSDNCSPGPETEAVVQEFIAKDPRIQYYRQEENQGPAFNFKFVLEKATGDYFMWAADDDEWDKSHIDLLIKQFLLENHHHSIVLSISGWENINPNGSSFGKNPKITVKGNTSKETFKNYLNMHPWFTAPACFIYGIFNREVLLNSFNNTIDLYCGKDLAIIIKSMCFGNIAYSSTKTWKKNYNFILPIPEEHPYLFTKYICQKYYNYFTVFIKSRLSIKKAFEAQINFYNFANELNRDFFNDDERIKRKIFLKLIREIIIG